MFPEIFASQSYVVQFTKRNDYQQRYFGEFDAVCRVQQTGRNGSCKTLSD